MKKIILIVILFVLVITLCSCNRTIIDTTYHFDRAQIILPDGSIVKGNIQKWRDYEGEQLQIRINGTTYLIHSENAVLISD